MNPLAGVLSEAWRMYRAHALHLLTIAFVIYIVAAIIEAVLTGLAGWVGAILAGIVGIVAAYLLQAALVKAVQDVRDGRADLSLGETVQAARPYILAVLVASILAGIAIGIGLILFIIPGLFLLTIWCLIVPVIVIENVGIGGSFGRSRELVRGYGWHVFGTIVLVFLVLLVVGLLIGIVLAALPDAFRGLISGVVSGTLIAPFLALVVTLAYYRLHAVQTGPPTVPEPPPAV